MIVDTMTLYKLNKFSFLISSEGYLTTISWMINKDLRLNYSVGQKWTSIITDFFFKKDNYTGGSL